jgi:hypothetical protein
MANDPIFNAIWNWDKFVQTSDAYSSHMKPKQICLDF